MGQLLEFLDLFLGVEVEFVELLDLLLEYFGVDGLLLPRLLLPNRTLPFLLNSFKKLDLAFEFVQSKFEVSYILALQLEFLLQCVVFLEEGFVIFLLEVGIVLLGLDEELLLWSGVE